jgi:hypothetical protein
MVVSGKKNLNPGRSMTKSPGSLKSGSADSGFHNTPTSATSNPMMIRALFIGGA